MRVFFIGGGSLARLCYNIIKKEGHEIPIVFDRTKGLAARWECVIFDDEEAIPNYARTCDSFLVCIGDAHGEVRTRYSKQLLQIGLRPLSAVHPAAYFGDEVSLGAGMIAFAGAVVNDFAAIGDFCILNSNCSVGHECVLGSGIHVMSSAALAGLVTIGDYSTVGTNATILPRTKIGAGCYVGAGAVVTKDVPNGAIVVGVPARIVRHSGASD